MVRLWGQNKAAYALATVLQATVLLVAGCGTPPARGQSAAQPRAASGSPAPSGPPAASRSPATAAIWLYSLQMTSASTGWALRWTQNPAVADDGYLAPARTTDAGARTWTSVTPPAARALLATPGAAVVLHALDGQRAWLAVTAATTDSSPVHLTEVFTTFNGGRTWTEQAPLRRFAGHPQLLCVAGKPNRSPDGLRRRDGTRNPSAASPRRRRANSLVTRRRDPADRDREQRPARLVRQDGARICYRVRRLAERCVFLPVRRAAGQPGRRRHLGVAGAAGRGQLLQHQRVRGIWSAVRGPVRVPGHRPLGRGTVFPGQPGSRGDLAE